MEIDQVNLKTQAPSSAQIMSALSEVSKPSSLHSDFKRLLELEWEGTLFGSNYCIKLHPAAWGVWDFEQVEKNLYFIADTVIQCNSEFYSRGEVRLHLGEYLLASDIASFRRGGNVTRSEAVLVFCFARYFIEQEGWLPNFINGTHEVHWPIPHYHRFPEDHSRRSLTVEQWKLHWEQFVLGNLEDELLENAITPTHIGPILDLTEPEPDGREVMKYYLVDPCGCVQINPNYVYPFIGRQRHDLAQWSHARMHLPYDLGDVKVLDENYFSTMRQNYIKANKHPFIFDTHSAEWVHPSVIGVETGKGGIGAYIHYTGLRSIRGTICPRIFNPHSGEGDPEIVTVPVETDKDVKGPVGPVDTIEIHGVLDDDAPERSTHFNRTKKFWQSFKESIDSLPSPPELQPDVVHYIPRFKNVLPDNLGDTRWYHSIASTSAWIVQYFLLFAVHVFLWIFTPWMCTDYVINLSQFNKRQGWKIYRSPNPVKAWFFWMPKSFKAFILWNVGFLGYCLVSRRFARVFFFTGVMGLALYTIVFFNAVVAFVFTSLFGWLAVFGFHMWFANALAFWCMIIIITKFIYMINLASMLVCMYLDIKVVLKLVTLYHKNKKTLHSGELEVITKKSSFKKFMKDTSRSGASKKVRRFCAENIDKLDYLWFLIDLIYSAVRVLELATDRRRNKFLNDYVTKARSPVDNPVNFSQGLGFSPHAGDDDKIDLEPLPTVFDSLTLEEIEAVEKKQELPEPEVTVHSNNRMRNRNGRMAKDGYAGGFISSYKDTTFADNGKVDCLIQECEFRGFSDAYCNWADTWYAWNITPFAEPLFKWSGSHVTIPLGNYTEVNARAYNSLQEAKKKNSKKLSYSSSNNKAPEVQHSILGRPITKGVRNSDSFKWGFLQSPVMTCAYANPETMAERIMLLDREGFDDVVFQYYSWEDGDLDNYNVVWIYWVDASGAHFRWSDGAKIYASAGREIWCAGIHVSLPIRYVPGAHWMDEHRNAISDARVDLTEFVNKGLFMVRDQIVDWLRDRDSKSLIEVTGLPNEPFSKIPLMFNYSKNEAFLYDEETDQFVWKEWRARMPIRHYGVGIDYDKPYFSFKDNDLLSGHDQARMILVSALAAGLNVCHGEKAVQLRLIAAENLRDIEENVIEEEVEHVLKTNSFFKNHWKKLMFLAILSVFGASLIAYIAKRSKFIPHAKGKNKGRVQWRNPVAAVSKATRSSKTQVLGFSPEYKEVLETAMSMISRDNSGNNLWMWIDNEVGAGRMSEKFGRELLHLTHQYDKTRDHNVFRRFIVDPDSKKELLNQTYGTKMKGGKKNLAQHGEKITLEGSIESTPSPTEATTSFKSVRGNAYLGYFKNEKGQNYFIPVGKGLVVNVKNQRYILTCSHVAEKFNGKELAVKQYTVNNTQDKSGWTEKYATVSKVVLVKSSNEGTLIMFSNANFHQFNGTIDWQHAALTGTGLSWSGESATAFTYQKANKDIKDEWNMTVVFKHGDSGTPVFKTQGDQRVAVIGVYTGCYDSTPNVGVFAGLTSVAKAIGVNPPKNF
jgi:hypothetical protein